MHTVPQIPFRFNVNHIILTVFITVCFFAHGTTTNSLSRNLLLLLLSLIEIIESVREEEEEE